MLTVAACSPVDMDGGEPVYSHVHVISDAFRAMVDKMCYLAVYGTKGIFENKVPASTRAQFHNYITDLHKGNGARQKFAEAWKVYVRANPPVEEQPRNQSMDEEMANVFGLGDSDDEQPAAGAAASAAGAAEGSEPATPPA